MVKVMMVVPALGTGGGEKIAIDIAANADKNKFEILIVSLYAKQNTILEKYAEKMNLKIVYLNKKLGFDYKVINKLRKVYNNFKPEVIHTHLYVGPYVLLSTPRKIIKYHTVHNLAEKEATGLLRLLMRIAYKFYNFIPVAISPLCAKSISELYNISLENIPCIMNGIDINHFKSESIPHQSIKFLNVGRFYPQKNQKMLLNAFKKVHECVRDTELEIVGDGYLRNELEEEIRKLQLSNAVIMNGETDRVDLKLNEADIYVMSSDYEGLPVSVLEAMACGLPIVTTAAGGTIDIVSDGINGIVVDIGECEQLAQAMITVAKDQQLRMQMGKNSRLIAEKFSIENCSMEYQTLYMSNNTNR